MDYIKPMTDRQEGLTEQDFYLHGEVVSNYWTLPSEIVKRVYDLGEANFFDNVSVLAHKAIGKASSENELALSTASCDSNCQACVNHSTTSFAYYWRAEDHPPADFSFTLTCRNAMSAQAVPAEARLRTKAKDKSGDWVNYDGQEIFDANCCLSMQLMAKAVSELFVEELESMEKRQALIANLARLMSAVRQLVSY